MAPSISSFAPLLLPHGIPSMPFARRYRYTIEISSHPLCSLETPYPDRPHPTHSPENRGLLTVFVRSSKDRSKERFWIDKRPWRPSWSRRGWERVGQFEEARNGDDDGRSWRALPCDPSRRWTPFQEMRGGKCREGLTEGRADACRTRDAPGRTGRDSHAARRRDGANTAGFAFLSFQKQDRILGAWIDPRI